MPSEISSCVAEEQRLKNYRSNLEHRNEVEERDLKKVHAEHVQRMLDTQAQELDSLRKDYEVRISKEAEALDEKLEQIRSGNEQKLTEEKRHGDEELEKLKTVNQQRIAEYRKNGESQVAALRKQLQASTETLQGKSREMSRKSAKREGLGV